MSECAHCDKKCKDSKLYWSPKLKNWVCQECEDKLYLEN